ncbi:MAG: glycosyltransferase [Deltaproteobacteria bacterium]|jgi:hypothetical protein|nr:glycosyltransferase [Deltaproteobacteria bacterium]
MTGTAERTGSAAAPGNERAPGNDDSAAERNADYSGTPGGKIFRATIPPFSGASSNRRRSAARPRVLFFRSGYFLDREIRSAMARLDWPVAFWDISDFRDASKDRDADFRKLLETIKAFRPDLVLTVNHLGFDSDGVLSGILGRLGIPAASWFVDSPWFILSGAELRPYRDLWAFSWDSDYLGPLLELGFANAAWLPLAADEALLEGSAAFLASSGNVSENISGNFSGSGPGGGSPSGGETARATDHPQSRDIAFVGDSLAAATEKYLALAGAGPEILPVADELAEAFLETGDLLPDPEAFFLDGVCYAGQMPGYHAAGHDRSPTQPLASGLGNGLGSYTGAGFGTGLGGGFGTGLGGGPGAGLGGGPGAGLGNGLGRGSGSGLGAGVCGGPKNQPGTGGQRGRSPLAAAAYVAESFPPARRPAISRDPRTLLNLSALVTWRASRMARTRVLSAMPPGLLTVAGDPGWRGLMQDGVALPGRIDYNSDLPGFYRGSRVNLNVTSAQMKTGVNQRVFDVPAAGGFLLTDRRAQLEELFLPEERCCYADPAEARELALWHLDRPEARMKVLTRARKAVADRHLYRHRLPEIARSVLGGWR